MRFLVFILVMGISYSIISQNTCTDKDIRSLNKKLHKKKTKSLFLKMELNFQLGTCYKGRNDSLSKHHFVVTTELANVFPCDRNMLHKQRLLYLAGLSYFELKEYERSETWLAKAIASKYQDSVIYYYYGLCNLNANKYKDALISFERQKELYPKVNEVMVGNCIQACKVNLSSPSVK